MREYWRLCSGSSVKRLCLNISSSMALYLNESSWHELNKPFLGTKRQFLYAVNIEYHYLPLWQSSKKHSKLPTCSKSSRTQSLDWIWIWAMPMRCPLQETPPVEGMQTPQTLRFAGEEMVISKSGILYHKEISRMDFYFQSGICFRDA